MDGTRISVSWTKLNVLADDFIRSLFHFTYGDVEVVGNVYNVDLKKFATKLRLLVSRREHVLDTVAKILGWSSISKQCSDVREVLKHIVNDPNKALNQLKFVETSGGTLRWGATKLVPASSVIRNLELSNGAFLWPGDRVAYNVLISCDIIGLIVLGMMATYIRGNVKESHYLIPLTPVKYEPNSADICIYKCVYHKLRFLDCELPEPLIHMLLYAIVLHPSSFKYIVLKTTPDKSWGLTLDLNKDFLLRILNKPGSDYVKDAIVYLAQEYCECEKRPDRGVCVDVKNLAKALAKYYTFVATGYTTYLNDAIEIAAYEIGRHDLAKPLHYLFSESSRHID